MSFSSSRAAFVLLLMALTPCGLLMAQRLVSEPIQGHTTPNSIRIWLMVKDVESVEISMGGSVRTLNTSGKASWHGCIPLEEEWTGFKPAASYNLKIKLDGKEVPSTWQFSTSKALSETPEDFAFTVGSCYLFGTGPMRLVRPGAFTGIFSKIEATKADFNIWLGDNVYLLLNEWNKVSRTYKKYTKVRLNKPTNSFLRSRPQYAITDDHDFGPDNSGSEFANKEMTSRCFDDFWPNPEKPDGAQGNYGMFSHQDCDFFLLDGRYNRIADGHQQMYGPEQMEWLRDGLKRSKATFKFISCGSQSLSEVNQGEAWTHYEERNEFLDFLVKEKVPGVVFLSGDRHFTEMMRLDLKDAYPLHELTCSPLTSLLRRKPLKANDPEHIHPIRVEGTLLVDHNFGRVRVEGQGPERTCIFEVYNDKGELSWTRSFRAGDLQF